MMSRTLKAETACVVCGEKYRDLLHVPFYARYVPLAVVADCPEHGLSSSSRRMLPIWRCWRPLTEKRAIGFWRSRGLRGQEWFKIRPTAGTQCFILYLDLFSSRQLLYLHHAIRLLADGQGLVKLNWRCLFPLPGVQRDASRLQGLVQEPPCAIVHVFGLHAIFSSTRRWKTTLSTARSPLATCNSFSVYRIVRGRKWGRRAN